MTLNGVRRSFLLWLALTAVYSANGREIGAGDSLPAMFLPVAILRGDGLHLDRFFAEAERAPERLAYPFASKRGHVVSRYPLATGLLALPFAAPQLALVDRLEPDWEKSPERRLEVSRLIGKTTAAAMTALVAVALLHVLEKLGLGQVALLATLVTALGSSLWTVASQSLWQHGPAALALIGAVALLLPDATSGARLVAAGAAVGLMLCFRLNTLPFAAAISIWVLWQHRLRGLWFFAPAFGLVGALLAYNLWLFGHALGGLSELLGVSTRAHAVSGNWSEAPFRSAAGTLLSPSRGLLVFTPWIVPALALLPVSRRRLRERPLIALLLTCLLLHLLQVSSFSVWWAGWSFGPRYWTEAMPVFGIVLAYALDWARTRSRAWMVVLATASIAAIAIHAVGAFCYPSSWNGSPTDIDKDPERLWDWRDSEITRCLNEGLRPAEGW